MTTPEGKLQQRYSLSVGLRSTESSDNGKLGHTSRPDGAHATGDEGTVMGVILRVDLLAHELAAGQAVVKCVVVRVFKGAGV